MRHVGTTTHLRKVSCSGLVNNLRGTNVRVGHGILTSLTMGRPRTFGTMITGTGTTWIARYGVCEYQLLWDGQRFSFPRLPPSKEGDCFRNGRGTTFPYLCRAGLLRLYDWGVDHVSLVKGLFGLV